MSEKVVAVRVGNAPFTPYLTSRAREGEENLKNKKNENKYWEAEQGETIEFGNKFMRCFDKAGKLQLGVKYKNKNTGEDVYMVKFVIDREELFASDEGASYLSGTINDWEEMLSERRDED